MLFSIHFSNSANQHHFSKTVKLMSVQFSPPPPIGDLGLRYAKVKRSGVIDLG
jgi:hypothetical protein